MNLATIGITAHFLFVLALLLRVMTRPHRDPASRIAWIAVITSLPFLGALIYLLFGETSIGRKRIRDMQRIIKKLPPAGDIGSELATPVIPDRYQHLFRTGLSVNGFAAVAGNSGYLLNDSNAAINAMVEDIDNAKTHVHLLFYIWLPDNNGLKMVDALMRAAARGVECRAMADDLGSRNMIHSQHWNQMQQAGVRVASALPIGNPLLRPFKGRIDLRNHRQILIIDNKITYCGSQNCADPEFLVKAKYAPWVDAMIRFEGPIARQNLHLFASDWMTYTNEDISGMLLTPLDSSNTGIPAQVIGTGPTVRYSAMPEIFQTLFHAARSELTISTPYFVPDESMQNALCAAAWRGVKTRILFPARNDSWIVGAASRSYYADLLEAGVEIYEYQGGLLHTKSLTLDDEITLIGSANMDRRSFDLNYENNILFYDRTLTAKVRERQQAYLDQARIISRENVESWPLAKRFWNNTLATLGPIL